MSWFTKLFIDEAKAALSAHGGFYGDGDDDTQMYILQDEDGTEWPAVLVDEETVFDATANDIREGKLAATEDGVTLGTKEIPAYITTEGVQIIMAGSPMHIKPGRNKHEYTKLLAVVCPFNTTLLNSVAAEKACIEGKVYPVASTESLATVTVNDDAKAIDLGIANDGTSLVLIRYFTYKEEN